MRLPLTALLLTVLPLSACARGRLHENNGTLKKC